MQANHILIAIDDSAASERAVQYVAQILRGTQDCQIVLLHVPAPIPPKLLEHGGAEDPAEEERVETTLDAAQATWTEKAERAAQTVFTRAQTILRQSHIPEHSVQTHVATPIPEHSLDTCILEAARTHACGTVVVGRETFSWLRELVQQHVADQLIQAHHGCAIWVVPEASHQET